MNNTNSINKKGLISLTQSELKEVYAGGFLFEGTVWLIAAIKGSFDKLYDTEDSYCSDDQTYSRRHGVCY